ncbi:MAG: type I 3-dehydroquinate dehydratase [Dehalococcoidales bacterium]|nr:MAG: type I 3-dehydroquinate dehydratase [Dehalococcoidales bacterium]
MKKAKICAPITVNNLKAIKQVEPLVDLFEVRIDLIGDGWQELARELTKPWIACNRCVDEGGRWQGNEARRIESLLQAAELGANIVDIELATRNLDKIVRLVKKRAECLLSFHDLKKTPSLEEMREIVKRQREAGADICKVVTTAQVYEDNLTVLKLIGESPSVRLISFTMGPMGAISRILCPLAGGELTYASIERGKESAPGQITVNELTGIYEMIFRNPSP